MLGVTDYGTFVVTIIVFLLIPGPGNLALITSTSKGRIPGGLAATMGVIAGDQVLMWSAVAGVAASGLGFKSIPAWALAESDVTVIELVTIGTDCCVVAAVAAACACFCANAPPNAAT